MAENVPPGGSNPSTKGTAATEERGLPYYEKLRRDLRDILAKKQRLDKNLASLEESIHRHETIYLEETSSAGNIIKGFDNYIKSSATTNPAVTSGTISGSAAGGSRRRGVVNELDRVFSRSSTSYLNGRESDSPSSAVTTPAGGTPTGSFGHNNAAASVKAGGTNSSSKDNKKKKSAAAREDDAEDSGAADGKPNKRQKISYGRD